ncbi:nudix hydrolase domain protein [Cystoisospora suis]|uniref:Nudix hydrolase domain protein n=1 Tax=Cystoisospora suis TaxID=483139 RepID=A0A2C6KFQ5_9APIC|nr:nudix hydrolase domain protein [Cystoisospora suis]
MVLLESIFQEPRRPVVWGVSVCIFLLFVVLVARTFSPPASLSSSLAPVETLQHHIRAMSGFPPPAGVTPELRGFALAWNSLRGYLLLKSEKKKKKGLHYQLPGGHADFPHDAAIAARRFSEHKYSSQGGGLVPSVHSTGLHPNSSPSSTHTKNHDQPPAPSPSDIARVAVARELYEETGIDVRENLDSLLPLDVAGIGPYNGRYFFFLNLTEEMLKNAPQALAEKDREESITTRTGLHKQGRGRKILPPEPNRDGSVDPSVKLAIGLNEHTGYRFEKDESEAAKMVFRHSGGNSSKALNAFRSFVRVKAPLSPFEVALSLGKK